MALRKFLFLNSGGFPDEQETDDTLELGGLTMSGDIAMGSNKITGLPTYNVAGNLLRYGQSNPSLAGLSPIYINMNTSYKVTGLADGSADDDAITKSQMDTAAGGTSKWLAPVEVANFLGPRTYAYCAEGYSWWDSNSGSGTYGDTIACRRTTYCEEEIIVQDESNHPPNGTRGIESGTGRIWEYQDGDTYDTPDNGSVTFVSGYFYEGNVTDTDPVYDWEVIQVKGSGYWFEVSNKEKFTYAPGDNGAITITSPWTRAKICSVNYYTWHFYPSIGYIRLHPTLAGMECDDDGAIRIKFAAATKEPGVETTSSGLKVKPNTDKGVTLDSNKLDIIINSSPETVVNAGGLKVTGLPSEFEINGTAVDSTVTATALNTMTDGSSNADTYHTHGPVAEAANIKATYTAGENIDQDDPVYVDTTNNYVKKAQADTESKSWVIGVATETKTTGQDIVIQTLGSTTTGTLSDGSLYFLGDSGGLSALYPSGGNYLVAIGKTYSTTSLFVNPQFLGTQAVTSAFTLKTTSERLAMSHSEGQMVYDTDLDLIFFDDGSRWQTDGPIPAPDLEDQPNYELLRCQVESVQRKV